jgi:hypothetical protein
LGLSSVEGSVLHSIHWWTQSSCRTLTSAEWAHSSMRNLPLHLYGASGPDDLNSLLLSPGTACRPAPSRKYTTPCKAPFGYEGSYFIQLPWKSANEGCDRQGRSTSTLHGISRIGTASAMAQVAETVSRASASCALNSAENGRSHYFAAREGGRFWVTTAAGRR